MRTLCMAVEKKHHETSAKINDLVKADVHTGYKEHLQGV